MTIIVSRAGMMSIINPHIMQVYEFRNYLIIGGFARSFNQFSFLISALISVLLSLKYKNANDLLTPYRIVAIFGVLFSSVGLGFSFFENDEKYCKNENEKNFDLNNNKEIESEENDKKEDNK